MKIIEQSHEILAMTKDPLQLIEKAGRTCYKSEDKITAGSAEKFVKMIVGIGHETVIEHGNATVRFITNRGVTHELVRHRLSSFSQESTRYVEYDNMEFIKPVWCTPEIIGEFPKRISIDRVVSVEEQCFCFSLLDAEYRYKELLNGNWKPEQAREVLPNALKTEIVHTCNFREWRHVLNLRCSTKAHPQIRALMLPLLKEFSEEVPVIFDDLKEKYLKE